MLCIEMNYPICSVCGKYADDGGLHENKFICHDCLDRKGIAEKDDEK